MKSLRLFVLMCVGFFILAPYSIVHAGSRAGAAAFTIGAGDYYFATKRHIANTGVGYGALGYDFTDHWGIEGLAGFMNTTSHQSQDNGKSVKGSILAIDGVYHFSAYKIVEPYISAGPGLIYLSPNGNDAHVEGNVNAALGLQFFVDKAVALRVEAHDFYTIVGGKNDIFLNGGVTLLWDIC